MKFAFKALLLFVLSTTVPACTSDDDWMMGAKWGMKPEQVAKATGADVHTSVDTDYVLPSVAKSLAYHVRSYRGTELLVEYAFVGETPKLAQVWVQPHEGTSCADMLDVINQQFGEARLLEERFIENGVTIETQSLTWTVREDVALEITNLRMDGNDWSNCIALLAPPQSAIDDGPS